jgi:hypothetical protein
MSDKPRKAIFSIQMGEVFDCDSEKDDQAVQVVVFPPGVYENVRMNATVRIIGKTATTDGKFDRDPEIVTQVVELDADLLMKALAVLMSFLTPTD